MHIQEHGTFNGYLYIEHVADCLTGYLLSFGSMVQNGKFSACASLFVSTLKNVDFLQIGQTKKGNYTSISIHKLHIFGRGVRGQACQQIILM